MTAKVIQGWFPGGQPKLLPSVAARLPPPIQAKTAVHAPGPSTTVFGVRPPGPPVPAFAARPPSAPALAFAGRQSAVQRHGAGAAFAVEAGPLGLASGGGRPLPEAVRGKMEAALGANFADVRVHVGPQAERIGAIAFTVGSDIYFAPGRFQPDTVHGQQLLGHELAHVVQQRAGRVRNPLGTGLAVVQDHALEAEADRLGHRAAAHRVEVQAKLAPGAVQPSSPVRISAPVSAGPDSYRLIAATGGHRVGSVMVHAGDKGAVEVTDLGVDQTQRGHGIGQMLVASAAKTGLQYGKSKVMLAAQDKGSGHLTRWYRKMGFTQIGVNQRGYPQLEAPISRVLAGTAQRHKAPSDGDTRPAPARWQNVSRPQGQQGVLERTSPLTGTKLAEHRVLARGCACGCGPNRVAQPASKKQRENKDYKVGNIGNRAATIKVPSGEEGHLLEQCFGSDPPSPYTTWHEFIKKNPMDRGALIGFCRDHLGQDRW